METQVDVRVAEPRTEPTTPTPGPAPRRRKATAWRVPWTLAAPAVLLTVATVFATALAGAYYAFTDWNGLRTANWVGFENFRQIFSTEETRGALVHTLQITVVFVLAVNIVGLALALALRRSLKSRNVLTSLFFLPVILSSLAVGYMWRYVFESEGLLNKALGAIGLESWQRTWLGDPRWAMWTVVATMVWQWAGLMMVIYLAGLQNIPDELVEAAAVDGAGPWMAFRRITFPLLAPSFTICVVLSMIHGMRAFDQIMALTRGGPVGATETLATQVYSQTFSNARFGLGAALSLLLTIMIAALAVVQIIVLGRREAKIG